MADEEVAITGNCNAPYEGLLQLPKTYKALPYRQVVVKSPSGRSRLIAVGVRADAGDAACVTGSMLSALGGEQKKVTFRRARFVDVLWLKDSVALQLAIAILGFALAILTGYAAWDKAMTAMPPLAAIGYWVAVVLLGLTAIVAALKCVKDVRDALN